MTRLPSCANGAHHIQSRWFRTATRSRCGTECAEDIRIVSSEEDLQPLLHPWQALVESALEPNPFFEPWFLQPALRYFGPSGVRFAFVFEGQTLVGLFPFACQHRYRGSPLCVLGLWTHPYSFLSIPLVHKAYARACFKKLFAWISSLHCDAIEFSELGANGPTHGCLLDALNEERRFALPIQRTTRAMLYRCATAEEHLARATSTSSVSKLRSKERKLAALGKLEYAELGRDEDAAPWIRDFLNLEASGWKGEAGTAMGNDDSSRRFFETAMTEAHRRGRLLVTALRLNGQPVAMRTTLRAGEGAFSFKIAYDESYGFASPGMLLEIDNLRRMHARPDLRWMDSCASPGSSMFERLWIDRRVIEYLLVPNTVLGWLGLCALPLKRWVTAKLGSRPSRDRSGRPAALT